jgi:hypothetical protein
MILQEGAYDRLPRNVLLFRSNTSPTSRIALSFLFPLISYLEREEKNEKKERDRTLREMNTTENSIHRQTQQRLRRAINGMCGGKATTQMPPCAFSMSSQAKTPPALPASSRKQRASAKTGFPHHPSLLCTKRGVSKAHRRSPLLCVYTVVRMPHWVFVVLLVMADCSPPGDAHASV